MSEDELIAWLRRRGSSRLIGDDAAILPENDRWAVTMDTQIAGAHFNETLDPADLARRLLAVNLSDLAAMGARPAYAFLALAAPPAFDHRRFFSAFLRCCERFEVELAGGDLARHSLTTAVLTLLGRKSDGSHWLRRDSARPNEHIWLGGTVGEAAAGLALQDLGARVDAQETLLPDTLQAPDEVLLAARKAVRRHVLPQPQLALGSWLGTSAIAASRGPAAIDVSDGLARDLHRLCAASGIGADIELARLPLAERFRRLCRLLDCNWRQLALGGGEDYVLLFTLPSGTSPPSHFGCTRIGTTRRKMQIQLVENDEKLMKCSSGRSTVSVCRFHAPSIFGWRTLLNRSVVRSTTNSSSRTIAP